MRLIRVYLVSLNSVFQVNAGRHGAGREEVSDSHCGNFLRSVLQNLYCLFF